eukprot:3505477-Rhodomonas_salina.1
MVLGGRRDDNVVLGHLPAIFDGRAREYDTLVQNPRYCLLYAATGPLVLTCCRPRPCAVRKVCMVLCHVRYSDTVYGAMLFCYAISGTELRRMVLPGLRPCLRRGPYQHFGTNRYLPTRVLRAVRMVLMVLSPYATTAPELSTTHRVASYNSSIR